MRRFVSSLALCYFVLVFFSPFSIAITSLEEGRANLSAFVRLFDLRLFGFVRFLFLLVSGKGLRLVIVALPGLFSYFILLVFFKLGMSGYAKCQAFNFTETINKRSI